MKPTLSLLWWTVAHVAIALALVFLLCTVAFADAGPEDVVRERVDLIEVNVMYDGEGRYNMAQQIFWEWIGERYRVIDWRTMKVGDQWPQRQWSSVGGIGGYKAVWRDGDVLREVYAPAFRYTETQQGVEGDPEVNDREEGVTRRQLRKPE